MGFKVLTDRANVHNAHGDCECKHLLGNSPNLPFAVIKLLQ